MSYDFYGPFVSAVIITDGGVRYPLWTDADEPFNPQDFISEQVASQGGLDEDEYTPRALAYLQGITVETDLGLIPRITATLTPPLEDARRLLNSRVIEWTKSILQVQYGYTTGSERAILSPVYEGLILEPQVSNSGDNASITLTAQGTGGFGLMRSKKGKVFNNMTRKDIIERVLAGPNPEQKRKIIVDDSAVRSAINRFPIPQEELQKVNSLFASKLGSGTLSQALLTPAQGFSNPNSESWRRYFDDPIVVSQGHVTDWMFVWRLVRECRCMMNLELSDGSDENLSVLRIFPNDLWFNSKPKRYFRYYNFPTDIVGPSNNTWPILSFDSQMSAIYLPAESRGFRMDDIKSSTGEEINEVATDAETKVGRVRDGQVQRAPDEHDPGPNPDTNEGLPLYAGNPEDDQVVAQAQAAFESMQTQLGLQMSVTTFLDPELFPGTTVRVEGISARHDGNFAVLGVQASAGEGGFTMTCNLIANAGSFGSLNNAAAIALQQEQALTEGNAAFSRGASAAGVDETTPQGPVNDQVPEEEDDASSVGVEIAFHMTENRGRGLL